MNTMHMLRVTYAYAASIAAAELRRETETYLENKGKPSL
jgi:hypothetical protein